MAITVIDKDDHGIRVDRWFKRYYPDISHIKICKLIRKGAIKLNGKKTEISDRVMWEDKMHHPSFEEQPTTIKKTPTIDLMQHIISVDDDIIALNKPAGLAVQGGSKISASIDDSLESIQFDARIKPKLVHRLDKETSGVLLIARNSATASELALMFKTKTINKSYIAIVHGVPKEKKGRINIAIEKSGKFGFEKVRKSEDATPAITDYTVISSYKNLYSLLLLHPITGKMHQLRVHCQHIGSPIVGDVKYNGVPNSDYPNNIFLHSYFTEFKFRGKVYKIKAPIPEHFEHLITKLRLRLPKI